MARNQAGATLQVRISGELHTRLQEIAEKSDSSISEVVRALLEARMGTPVEDAAVAQALWAVHAKLRNALANVGPDIADLLRDQLASDLAE